MRIINVDVSTKESFSVPRFQLHPFDFPIIQCSNVASQTYCFRIRISVVIAFNRKRVSERTRVCIVVRWISF